MIKHQVVAFMVFVGVAQATVILDQSNTPGGGILNTQNFEFQQQVTDGIGGTLAGIELFTSDNVFCSPDPGCPINTEVSIGLGAGIFTGSFAFSIATTLIEAGTFIDTSAADISLTPGEQFVIDVLGTAPFDGVGLAASNNVYGGGSLFCTSCSPAGPENNTDMAFETFIEASASPEPGTLALLGAGLFGLAWLPPNRWRRGLRIRGGKQ